MSKIKLIPFDYMLDSTTDTKGVITEANKDFAEICNMPIETLVGKPHNIIRHSDMPEWIFKEMWQTLKKGEEWSGVIKNKVIHSDVSYWVITVITPIFDKDKKIIAYNARRRQASTEEILKAKEKYSI